ncbi:hypothetical protein CROQUDRAFT_36341, partial [Cronartium quercuum f. sp. fusiforme G11]
SLEHFKIHLAEQNVTHKIVFDYTSILPHILYAVALSLDNPSDVGKLEASNHVQSVKPTIKIKAIKPVKSNVVPALLNLTSVPFPPHVQTGITKLHSLGYYGKGVKIAVLDSAVDCSHPALGGGFGKGFRISFGRDLSGDEEDDSGDPQPDDNPCGTCSSHGTHVMGILAASGKQGLIGVSPESELGLYLFGCGEKATSSDELILAGLLQARKDGADIISASVGGVDGWGQSSVLLDTINKLVEEEGVTIIGAAGNEAENGLFYPESPASAKNAISVGSVESAGRIAASLLTSTGREISYHTSQSYADVHGSLPVYRTSNSSDVKNDACNPLPSSTPNLANYIVLIQRGYVRGPNSTEIITFGHDFNKTRIASLSHEDGLYIFEESKKDPTGFKLSFRSTAMKFLPYPDSGFMSNFSNFGPSFDFLSIPPAVSGVGGEIVSTVPMINGSYASMSGTSMATPQIAGIAALIMSVRAKMSPEGECKKKKKLGGLALRRRLISTAQPVFNYSSTTILETVVRQGGGLVNAYCAAFSNTTVSRSALALNDSSHFNGTQTFYITNEGYKTVNYLLAHIPAATMYTYAPDTKYYLCLPSILVTSTWMQVADTPCESHNVPYFGAVGSIKDQKIIDHGPSLEPNKTYHYPHLQFEHENVTEASTNKQGELEWSLSKQNETYVVFRTNFGSALVRLYIISAEPRRSLNQQSKSPKWVKKKSRNDQYNTKTAENSNWNNFTSHDQRKNLGPVDSWTLKIWQHVKDLLHPKISTHKPCSITDRKYPQISCEGYNLLGEIPDEDLPHFPRSPANDTWQSSWNGTLLVAEGQALKKVPHGKYRILMKALRITADPTQINSYETWTSPIIALSK